MKQINFKKDHISNVIKNKKVLFITTKNIDYIRNSQEIELLKKLSSEVEIIGYDDKGYISRLIKIYWKLITISIKNYDEVFVGFAPQLILPFFGFKFRKKVIIEDFFISLYDTMINDRKKFKSSSLIGKILLYLDRITLKRADEIIVDTHAHGNYFVKELGADKSKINVMYLMADSSIYYPRTVKKSKELNNKFLVLYFGSILPLQGIEVILQCIEKMKDIESVIFQIIGPVPKEYMDKYKTYKNVVFIPWLSQKALAEKIAAADLCLAGHFNNSIEKALRTIPGKAYIYDAMEKPMILGDNPANHELFKEDNDNYYYVEMGSSDKLKEKILYVMENKKFPAVKNYKFQIRKK